MSKCKFILAALLLLGVFGLIALVVCKPEADDMLVAGMVGQLLAALIFVLHSIFRDPSLPNQETPK